MRMRWRRRAVTAHQLAAQVVRRGAGDADLGVGAGGGHRGVGRGEVHQLVLAGPAGEHVGVPLARPLDDHLLDPADPGLVPGQRGALHHHPEPLEALGHHVVGHERCRHRRRPGPRSGREDEGVGAVVLGLGRHLEGALEVVVGLAREARR